MLDISTKTVLVLHVFVIALIHASLMLQVEAVARVEEVNHSTIVKQDMKTIWATRSSGTVHTEVEACWRHRTLPGTWNRHIPPYGSALQLHGTSHVLQDMWKHQHPPNCSQARFLVFYKKPLGIGATLDLIGSALGLAVDSQRVLLLDFQDAWTRAPSEGPDFCRGFRTLDSCFLEPLSSCTLKDVYGADFFRAYNENPDDAALAKMRQQLHGERVQFMAHRQEDASHENKVPDCYRALASYRGVHANEYIGGIKRDVYWFRSHAMAYVVRPNNRTLAVLEETKAAQFPGQSVLPGTISVHVRHGDKGSEMRLMPDDDYVKAAEIMLKNTHHLRRQIFLSTEDPATIEYFESLPVWSVQHTLFKRTSHGGRAPHQVANPAEEFLHSLLNLDLAADCEAYICTLSSMWCGLVDRIRSTVRCRAGAPYIDVHGSLTGLGHRDATL